MYLRSKGYWPRVLSTFFIFPELLPRTEPVSLFCDDMVPISAFGFVRIMSRSPGVTYLALLGAPTSEALFIGTFSALTPKAPGLALSFSI
jgi:hypothetical protein